MKKVERNGFFVRMSKKYVYKRSMKYIWRGTGSTGEVHVNLRGLHSSTWKKG